MELLLMIPRIGIQSGFTEITVNENLEPVFPKEYLDPEVADDLIRALAPPPPASSDEIVTPMAGTYYCREAPHLPALVEEGQHFEVGQPLFIIEVMKMFNKIVAPFSGTLTRDLMKDSDGQIVAKGERVFEIEPDETPIIESDEEIAERRSGVTLGLLG
jgi:biotin carboxyl carrier protein